MGIFSKKGPSGFSASSTAEKVTHGIDGTGLTAIVTGASGGIGAETSRVLVLRGVHVVMAVRNMDSGLNVKQAILKEIPNAKIDVMELDLSTLASVRKFAANYNALGLPLNILMKGASGFSASSTAEEVTQGIDGTGLTAIVTGASSGIGLETSRVLALRGVRVVMAVRNTNAGTSAKDAILKEILNAKIDVMELDLSSLASVRKFVAEYNSLGLPLNILINNAGVMANPYKLSEDNIELQFATNHLGHFLLTNLLLETMKSTSRESGKEGRIVNVSSIAHRYVYGDGLAFDKINDKSRYNKYYAYGQSKLANILHANELTRRLKEEGVEITANSLHPGAILTNLLRYENFLYYLFKVLGIFISKTIPQGAATTCFVALHPQVKGVGGEYFVDSNIAKPSSLAKDADMATKLWDFSLSLTNLKE